MTLIADIWSVLSTRQRRWVVGAQLVSILMALSTVMGIASIAPFFAVLGNPALIHQVPQLRELYGLGGFSSAHDFCIALGIAFMGLVLLANLINVGGSFITIRLAMSIGADLQAILFEEYLGRPYLFHARTHSSVLFNNLMHETTRSTHHLLLNTFALNTNLVTAMLILTSVMLLNPWLAAGLLAALAGGYLAIYLAVRNRLARFGEIESRFFIAQSKIVNETLGAIRNILLQRTQAFFGADFQRSSRAFARAASHTQLIAQSPRYVMESVAVVGLVAAALVAGGREGGIGSWLGQLTFLGFAAYRLLPSLQQAFAAMVKIRADRPGFNAIAPDLRLARARAAPAADAAPAGAPHAWPEGPRSSIALENVSFRYEADRPPALSGVSLRIAARTLVGIVGINGSGKTTLVDLIAGLLVPAEGRLEVDGIVVDPANRPDWQAHIAYVPQQIFLMDASIAQNIALGVPDASIDRTRLALAARLAQLGPLIEDLPQGFEHRVGERGTRLSGGQRQRIGIARALYSQASVLILDEATNALDGLTERELQSTLAGLRGRYTVILITHRLSSVRACDRIFEFDRGTLARCGTYDSLRRESDAFRRLGDVA